MLRRKLMSKYSFGLSCVACWLSILIFSDQTNAYSSPSGHEKRYLWMRRGGMVHSSGRESPAGSMRKDRSGSGVAELNGNTPGITFSFRVDPRISPRSPILPVIRASHESLSEFGV